MNGRAAADGGGDEPVLDRFKRDGYVVVRRLVDQELCERVRAAAADEFDRRPGADGRLMDLWRWCAPVRDLAVHPPTLHLLDHLYGRRPVPFQTLDFDRGTAQPAHADTAHFDTEPPDLVAGVWVALEDVGPDQGPLVVHPGSHRATIPLTGLVGGRGAVDFDRHGYEARVATAMANGRFDTVDVPAHRGDTVIWAARLVHGGAPVRDPESTRWSQVTHHFFEGCRPHTPLAARAGGARVYRDDVVDIRTGRTLDGRRPPIRWRLARMRDRRRR